MSATLILFLTFLSMTLAGCDKKTDVSKSEAAMVKELTPEQMFTEIQKQAEAGNAHEQARLGLIYSFSFEHYGIPKDDAKAAEWFQKAAMQGDADAQVFLGIAYAAGDGLPKDVSKAVEWFQKAAIQGNADAQTYLGIAYATGDGLPKDAAKAAEWFQKAAIQGDARGQARLGQLYFTGNGLPKDAAKAAEWFQKAAIQGDEIAQLGLGTLYFIGEGIVKNLLLGYAWANLAAAQGNDRVIEMRDSMEKQLSPEQIVEGQRLASNWKIGDNLVLTPTQ